MKVSSSTRPRPDWVAPAVVAGLYLVAHLPSLAPALEDIDSINFGLGLRQFDPLRYQPHPPGYPVYMALGRVSLFVVERLTAMTGARADALALAVWSAIGGAACLVAAWCLFVGLASRGRRTGTHAPGALMPGRALWATVLLACAPLYWMTGLRPMSDMPGLALAVAAQALLLRGSDRTRLVQGALLAGLATGIRVQTAVLTGPLLLFVLAEQRGAGIWWLLSRPVTAFAAGCLAWGVPLVVASGGMARYLLALGNQGGADFAWVDMLWSNPTPRHLALALYQTLVLPWASVPLAVAVGVTAAVGAAVTLVRDRGVVLVLLVAFAPYLVFHLLFQETITVRYALPFLPPLAWLSAVGVTVARRWASVLAAPLAVGALVVAVPAGVAYGRDPHPAFRAIADAVERARTEPPAAVFSHYAVLRPLQVADIGAMRVVEPPLRFEWLGLVEYWKHGGVGPVWFFADRRRTDLALIDPRSRRDVVRYRWAVEQRPELSGTRPVGVDWYRLAVPGWFAGEGWSLTPEAGGVTEATSTGPDHRPIEAWVRRRPGPYHLVVGVRHLGRDGDADADVAVAIDGREVARWTVPLVGRNVLHVIDLPQGVEGPGAFAHLTIVAHSVDARRRAPVAVRQFDIQPSSQLIYGYGAGWHEDEYVVETGLTWRWTSERAVLHIESPAQAVRVTLRGESPLRYVHAIPTVSLTAGGVTVAQFHPGADFEWSATIAADALARAGGDVAIATDRVYLPGPAEGTADARHLGLRIFDVRVDPVSR